MNMLVVTEGKLFDQLNELASGKDVIFAPMPIDDSSEYKIVGPMSIPLIDNAPARIATWHLVRLAVKPFYGWMTFLPKNFECRYKDLEK